MISVKSGVKAFNIPDKALERCWPAIAKRIAGMRFPVNPASKKEPECLRSMCLKRLMKIGKKNKLAEQIRKAPTWSAE